MVSLFYPGLHNSRNLQIVLLQKREVTIAMNPNIAKLDPLNLHASLAQIIHHALIIRYMWRRLPGQGQILHLRNLGQLPGRLRLIDARSPRRGVRLVAHRLEIARGVGRRIVRDAGVGEAPWTIGRAAYGAGGVARVGLEGDGGGFEVDVAGYEVGTLVAEEDGMDGADGVADEVGAADEGEEGAAGGAHEEFLAGEVVG